MMKGDQLNKSKIPKGAKHQEGNSLLLKKQANFLIIIKDESNTNWAFVISRVNLDSKLNQ